MYNIPRLLGALYKYLRLLYEPSAVEHQPTHGFHVSKGERSCHLSNLCEDTQTHICIYIYLYIQNAKKKNADERKRGNMGMIHGTSIAIESVCGQQPTPVHAGTWFSFLFTPSARA